MNKNKTAIMLSLILMFAMLISLAAVPLVKAQPGSWCETYCLINAVPNPACVNEPVTIMFGLTRGTSWPQPGWYNMTVEVTRPDNKTEIFRGLTTDPTGVSGLTYVPTTTGTYYLQCHFPEQIAEYATQGVAAGTTMRASSSIKIALVVTDEPGQKWPGMPLPTEYWTRPIDRQLREWSSISGNWVSPAGTGGMRDFNQFAPYNEGPETAHILWRRYLTDGGLIGGPYNDFCFGYGDAYEGKWAESVIIAGRLFYNEYISTGGTAVEQIVVSVDLRTGEQIWRRPLIARDNVSRRLSHGQIYYVDTMNYRGAYSYLWTVDGTTWHAFDTFTGRWEYTMSNVPTAPATPYIYGPNGEIIRYTVSLTGGWMTKWNSSNIRALWGDRTTFFANSWRPQGKTVNATGPADPPGGPPSPVHTPLGLEGYHWNVTIPRGLPGSVSKILEDRILGGTLGTNGAWTEVYLWAISTAPGREGMLLFNKTWTAPARNVTVDIPQGSASVKDGVFIIGVKELQEYHAFNIDTGEHLWKTEREGQMATWTILYHHSYRMQGIAYGKYFTAGFDGVVTAYDIKTGKTLWKYEAIDPYDELAYHTRWAMYLHIITDNKLYLSHSEHSGLEPGPRGAPFICLDAETGKEIWRINGAFRTTRSGGQPIIGDGVIATFDTYDNVIYAIGKGPSSTTVKIQNDIITHGNKAIVQGMVLDVSPGTKSAALQLRFPNGVPAVADQSMSDWMLYIYKQFPRPTDAKGVEVVISVLDPNNNCYEVGRTTSDANGFFKLSFEPPVPGEYTVIATFPGSKAYYGSSAETALFVEESPPESPPPTPPPQEPVGTYFTVSTVVIIIAIAIAAVLLLRKR